MKLKYKSIMLSILIVLCAMRISAQLKVGDKYYDVELNHVINYTQKSIRLSDFKQKLIVLDFWGTGCSGCIAGFPYLDSMQKTYGSKVQIIMVNKSSEDSTTRFFTQRKRIKVPKVPLVTDAALLYKDFPHIFEPMQVWIDSTGTICHITNSENLTGKNIEDYYARKKLIFFERNDTMTDYSKPLLVQQDGIFLNRVDYYSYLMHFPGVGRDAGNEINFGKNGLPIHVVYNAMPIPTLFKKAYEEWNKYDFNYNDTFILNVTDASGYIPTKDLNKTDEWEADNTYDYELEVPDNGQAKLFEFMKQDMLRYFNLKAKIEKKAIKCLALVRTSKIDKLRTKGGIPEINFFSQNGDSILYAKNYDFDRLTVLLNGRNRAKNRAMPLLDETGYTGKIDIQLNKDDVIDYNLPNLRKELAKYDLDIIEVQRLQNVLIVSEPNHLVAK